MSGGVDSSVAAARLLNEGYEVEGLFMKNWDELHSANFAAEYWDGVFEAFLAEYAAGFTPNPDVLCNREIKFKQFADYAQRLGADFIATGHYARMVDGHLHKARDQNKDQTYFLQDVPLERLKGCLFPLGEVTKPEVRQQAKAMGLANHAKKDSTGICFIGERRLADFLSNYLPERPGQIIDEEGKVLGQHRGTPYYTVGQRKGLGIGGQSSGNDAAWFVVTKNTANNTLVVSQRPEALQSRWLRVESINWLLNATPDKQEEFPRELSAKVRYRQEDQPVALSASADGGYLLTFEEPQRAIAPGQYACLYEGDRCLGGGRITACEPARAQSQLPFAPLNTPPPNAVSQHGG